MTYAAAETSVEGGSPQQLFEFSYMGRVLAFTNGPADLVIDGRTFLATTIAHSDFEDTDEIARNDITVTVPRDNAAAELFRIAPPSETVLLTIFEVHADDVDEEKKPVWTGRVMNCDWRGLAASLRCESIYTSLKTPGLRRLYQRNCGHVLYGPRCRLSNLTYQVSIGVEVVNGITLEAATLAEQVDGYYDGGYAEWESTPGLIDRRAVRSHIGAVITITHPFVGMEAGATIKVYPGCDHTLATCHAKFANSANFGGFPNMPKKNPFAGTSLA